jgi:acetate kinase
MSFCDSLSVADKHARRAGSSSFKFKLYSERDLKVVSSGSASAIGTDDAALKVNSKKSSIKGESHHQVFQDARY